MQEKSKKKVFVLGDSRTGTTSLHRLFLDYGFNSVHYFVDEVNEIAKKDGHEKHEYKHFKEFVDESGFNAFTDYPTRIYFRQLRRDYPDAFFILSLRQDSATWRKSMRRFFQDQPDILENMPHLAKVHAQVNNQIRKSFSSAKRFIEICIDDGNEVNSPIISKFLQEDQEVELKKLNATG